MLTGGKSSSELNGGHWDKQGSQGPSTTPVPSTFCPGSSWSPRPSCTTITPRLWPISAGHAALRAQRAAGEAAQDGAGGFQPSQSPGAGAEKNKSSGHEFHIDIFINANCFNFCCGFPFGWLVGFLNKSTKMFQGKRSDSLMTF